MIIRNRKHFFAWFLLGCLLSLLAHFFLFKKIRTLEIASFNPSSFDAIVPRKFHLERVKIDPALLEEPENKETTVAVFPKEIKLSEKQEFSSQSPLQKSTHKPLPLDNNKLEGDKPKALLENSLIPELPERPNQALLPSDPLTKESSIDNLVSKQSTSPTGYSGLDQLLEQQEPLSSQTAPILLPTDLLFEYDDDQLKLNAEESLKKLAHLIQRNPKAEFIVEGFTDSFGSDEYNLDLSSRRANSIKVWLITKENINPDQIQSYGLGKTHFIVPSNGTIQEQGLNRRVEVVIRQK